MTLGLLWLQLGATAAVIFIASQFLTRSADVVAEKTGLGRTSFPRHVERMLLAIYHGD